MKIKRFVAADMRSAMNLVRKEHGPDAVILSNRRIPEGVEIVASAHYDESAVQRALEANQPKAEAKPRSAASAMIAAVTRRKTGPVEQPQVEVTTSAVEALARAAFGNNNARTAPAAEPQSPAFATLLNEPGAPATHALAERGQPARAVNRAHFDIDPQLTQAAPAAAAAAPAPSAAPARPRLAPTVTGGSAARTHGTDAELQELRREVAGMRQMIEREVNRFTDERLRGNIVRANALDLMEEYGFDPGLCRDVAAEIPLDTEKSRSRGLMLGLLSKKLPIDPIDPLEAGGVVALVGPTGAGKTSTIAKLAMRFVARNGARDIALVTTDTQRVGAREQLYSIGRQLGVAVHEANSGTNLNDLLQRLADYKLVLIDTAGLGQRDRALASQLQWLRASGQIRTLLVLPANTAFQDMDEVVRRFAAAAPQGLILSKLDETGRLGSALSIAVDHKLPITWITDGQDIPQDLHRASATNLVLRLEDLRRAADMPCWTPELNHAVA